MIRIVLNPSMGEAFIFKGRSGNGFLTSHGAKTSAVFLSKIVEGYEPSAEELENGFSTLYEAFKAYKEKNKNYMPYSITVDRKDQNGDWWVIWYPGLETNQEMGFEMAFDTEVVEAV